MYISEIGTDVEIKFWNEAEIVKQRALAEQEELLNFIAEEEQQRAVEEALKVEQHYCKEQIRLLQGGFKEILGNALNALEITLLDEYEVMLKENQETIDRDWQQKLEQAVEEGISEVIEYYTEEMKKLEESLMQQFRVELK